MSESVPRGFPRAHLPSLRARIKVATEVLKAGGETIAGVEISPEGAVRILTGGPVDSVTPGRAGSVDRLLRRIG